MTLREALLAMGYTEAKPGRWLKPVGYHLFTFDEAKRTWRNYFKGGTGEIMIWESRELPEDNALSRIKEAEAYTKINVEKSINSSFELQALDV